MQIKDHVFIVTGAASGLGAATARMLVDEGGHVVLADIQRDAGEALAASFNGRAHFVCCDVTVEADGIAAVHAAAAMGSLRGLVNCAGIAPAAKTIGRDGPHPLSLFRKTVDINLVGTFNLSRLAAAAIAVQPPLEDGERGIIIHTSSIAGTDGQVGQAAYAASKAAIAGMTLPMARDLARHGIRVMAIAPGIFETPMYSAMPQDVRHALAATIPFPSRPGKPHEYAHLVRAIIDNPMLNGETIRLDGAIRMQPR